MLADLLEVRQWVLLSAHDSGHAARRGSETARTETEAIYSPTKGSFFQLLASVQAVSELEEAKVILGNGIE